MEKICGIYCIENKKNGKKYIGQSVDIYKRWIQHKRDLSLKNSNENNHFINAWHFYGEENFSFWIIEKCDVTKLNEKEKYWIQYYNTTDNTLGYNKTTGGTGGNTLINYSENELEDYKKRKSILLKECSLKGESAPNSKLSKKDVLEIIKRFQNGEYDTQISESYKVSMQTINDIRKRRTWNSVTKKYKWPESDGCKTSKKHYIAIDMYTKDGVYIKTYENARIASAELGIGYKLISAVCHGDKRSAGGYVWRLHNHPFNEYSVKFDNYVPVNQYDMNGNFIRSYKSIKEANAAIGVYINSCVQGKSKSAGGYIWKYANK